MPRPNTGPKLVWISDRNRFYVIWFQSGKRHMRSTKTSDHKVALRYYLNFLKSFDELVDGTAPSELQITAALKYYEKEHAINCVDPERIRHCIQALNSFWGDKTIDEINQANCNSYSRHRKQSRKSGIADATIRRELATLKAAMEFCVRERKLARSVYVPLPPKSEPRDRWLTVSEAAKLLRETRHGGRNSSSYLSLFVLIALYTGARSEAILSLTWDRVNLSTLRINFDEKGRPKTKKRRPIVPISPRLAPFLRYAYKKRCADDGPVLHIDGKPILRINRGFSAAAKRAGFCDVTPHTLRHTCATWMAQRGVSMFEIAGFLGQGVDTTSRHYAHHSNEFLSGAVASTTRKKSDP